MEWFKEWVSGICAVTVVFAIARGVTPQNPSGRIVTLAGSLIVVLSLISPLVRMPRIIESESFAKLNAVYDKIGADINDENKKIYCEIIEKEISEYIFSQAEKMDVPCRKVNADISFDTTGEVKVNKIKVYLDSNTDEQTRKSFFDEIRCDLRSLEITDVRNGR